MGEIMKELFDIKISAQRNLERAGRTFSITAWEYRKAIRNKAEPKIIDGLRYTLAEHRALMVDAADHHERIMEKWYKFRPADRHKIGIVLMPSDVYVK